MDTVLLNTFLEVSKTRHFGRAAENLFITHSTVSFRIRQLEDKVGSRLFNRQRNNLSLTEAGERLIPYAESMLASWQMALQEVGMPTRQFLQMGIGGTANIWDAFLQRLLPDMAIRFPDSCYRTEVSSQVTLVRSLLERSIDVGLVFDPPKIAEVSVEPVAQLQLLLVCHQPAVSLEQLAETGYVFVDWGTTFNLQHAKLFPQPVAPVLHTGQSVIAREYLLRRGGVAFLPESWLSEGEDALYPVVNSPVIVRDVYAIYMNDTDKLESVQALTEFMAQYWASGQLCDN